ncbi:MAG: magnesium/cobalt transporter CorA [Planctomycetaceae bacterium]|uniref:Magnesium transport protein CorA n=1 Tax=Lacipirellula limnantheis TaxID=2528024 RepID=A0A517TSP9_9BACT|nr:magnesium/cobalt transporter CorA [Lacipirellula limnantheis]MBL9165772.1 magnesium/cobalt transporter CorA [Planctomycetaceae bacterium]QDT71393.1 Magnesium transport protein CorA [Lacipirellula limnantheis]
MSKKGKNGARRHALQRRRFDHTLHPHTRPGTIIVPPESLPPLLQITAYGPDVIVEKRNATAAQIRELRGKYPVVWIDAIGLGDARLIEEIGEMLGLHRLSLEDMVNVPQRSKVEDYPHHLFAVTQIPTYNGDLSLEQVSFFAGKGFVLSWREHAGHSFDIVRKRLQVTGGTTRSASVDYLLYALIDAVIDSYFPVLEQLGEVFDDLDDRVEADSSPACIAQMREIRHDTRQLRRIIWPLRDAIDDLIRSPPEHITQETLIHFRDCHDHTVQIMDTLENYRDAGSDLRDYYATSISNRMNETIKVLTIISTIFMPLSFIAGVYGMNFQMMPELGWKYGYPFALSLMGIVAAMQLWFFRRRGWIGRGKQHDKEAKTE